MCNQYEQELDYDLNPVASRYKQVLNMVIKKKEWNDKSF